MNTTFRAMLLEAERIRMGCRATQDIRPHAQFMSKMICYGREQQLLLGSLENGTASEEFLAQAAEMAACILEVIHGENIGSVLALSREEKMEIILRAKEKAESDITAAKRRGLL